MEEITNGSRTIMEEAVRNNDFDTFVNEAFTNVYHHDVNDALSQYELEVWTDSGVDQILTVEGMDNTELFNDFLQAVDKFDAEEEVASLYEDERYRENVGLREGLNDMDDYKAWLEELKQIIVNTNLGKGKEKNKDINLNELTMTDYQKFVKFVRENETDYAVVSLENGRNVVYDNYLGFDKSIQWSYMLIFLAVNGFKQSACNEFKKLDKEHDMVYSASYDVANKMWTLSCEAYFTDSDNVMRSYWEFETGELFEEIIYKTGVLDDCYHQPLAKMLEFSKVHLSDLAGECGAKLLKYNEEMKPKYI